MAGGASTLAGRPRRRTVHMWSCVGAAVVLALVGAAVRADDEDLVASTVREAQSEHEGSHDATTADKRPPRYRPSAHPLTDLPPPGDFVTTSAHLVSHEGLTWRAGDEVVVLCRFAHRVKSKTVNVTGLMGSLNSPVHFGYYLQNFTFDDESYAAAALEEVTFDYAFTLDPSLDPGSWQVALTVYYSVGRQLFATTFFNETVTLDQPPGSLFALWLFPMLVAAVVFTYLGRDHMLAGSAAARKASAQEAAAKARAEQAAAARAAADDESWIAHLDTTAKGPSKRGGGSKKTSKGGAKRK